MERVPVAAASHVHEGYHELLEACDGEGSMLEEDVCVCLSFVCLSVCLSVRLSVRLSVCLCASVHVCIMQQTQE